MPEAAYLLYLILDVFQISMLMGPIFEQEIVTKVCPADTDICELLQYVNTLSAEYASDVSAKHFAHFIEMAYVTRFQDYISTPFDWPAVQMESNLIPTNTIASPAVFGIFAGSDQKCNVVTGEGNLNQLQLESIASYAAGEIVIGAGGMNWIGANDQAFMDMVT